MKSLYYVIIPLIALSLIIVNAFFGNLLFTSETQQVIHKYTVYVHLLSNWDSDSKNIIFDVTNYWYNTEKNNNLNYVLNAKSKEYNTNQIQTVNDKSYVELKYEFSNCNEEWQPILYRKAVDNIRQNIEYVQGKQLSADPDISIFPNIENTNYDNSEQQSKIKNGYAQFFPICTSKEFTSYNYSIKTENKDLGFDVYFVSSQMKREEFFNSDFDYYQEPGCFAQNRQSFSGTCNNIQKDGGLLVIFPDEFKPWTSKVIVNLYEKE